VTRTPRDRAPALLLGIVLGVVLALAACGGSESPLDTPKPAVAAAAPVAPPQAAPDDKTRRRDLLIDESQGGHTLARHVGKTDAELASRLARERQISAASTYTDRPTAERVVGAALDSAGGKLSSWIRRTGRRPNLVLNYADRSGAAIGRSLFRGARRSVPCVRALVVLKWNESRDRFYVLTSYPEADR